MLLSDLGKSGERAAQRYLLYHGLRILEVNWRLGGYEIDIIASDGRHLLVVEVKSRIEYTPTRPADAVDTEKAYRLIHAGRQYRSLHKLDLPIRYDVVEALYCPASDVFEITYLKDYFNEVSIALQRNLVRHFPKSKSTD